MARRWLRRRTAIILAVVVVVLAVLAAGLLALIERSQENLLAGIHDSCVSSATETARGRGVDVANPELVQKIDRYCSCVAESVRSGKVTTTELSAFSADPQASDPTTTKVRQVVASCLR
jgi:hypothetical protein